jgi:hypothetical protein
MSPPYKRGQLTNRVPVGLTTEAADAVLREAARRGLRVDAAIDGMTTFYGGFKGRNPPGTVHYTIWPAAAS